MRLGNIYSGVTHYESTKISVNIILLKNPTILKFLITFQSR